MPTLAESDDDTEAGGDEDSGVVGSFDGVEHDDAEKEATARVGEADLGLGDDNGIVSGFDGVEDEQGDESESESSSGGTGGGSGDPTIESAIENGLSEVACIGLDGGERDRVYGEMNAIAERFKIGYFGEQCVQKYLKRDIENIPPEYGLVAALIAFGAIAIYKRPDGEERVQHAVSIVKEKLSADDEQAPPEQQPPRDPRPSRQRAPQQPADTPQPQPQPQPQPAPEPEPVAEVDEPVEAETGETPTPEDTNE